MTLLQRPSIFCNFKRSIRKRALLVQVWKKQRYPKRTYCECEPAVCFPVEDLTTTRHSYNSGRRVDLEQALCIVRHFVRKLCVYSLKM